MRVTETLQKYIEKIFGKGGEAKLGDYAKCRRCRLRFKVTEAPSQVEDAISYDRKKFCSADCQYPKPASVRWGKKNAQRDSTRPILRHNLRMRAQKQINEKFPGEKRRQRRLIARKLAANWYKQEMQAKL